MTAPRVLTCALLALSTTILLPQIRTGISKENARHLWYVSYINDFGVGYVEWQYGELQLESAGISTPVYLELTPEEWKSEGASSRRNGSPLPGADRSIGINGRSRPFRYRPGSTLSFFRLWHAVNTSLESHRPSSDVVQKQRSWADVRWTVMPGMVADTMEVALALVDAVTGERIALLDSVGVAGSGTDALYRRYGTSPDWSIHRVRLPDVGAERLVAIEPLPYRYGPTPVGLLVMKRFNTFNMSVLFEHEREERFPDVVPRSENPDFSARIDSAYGHDLRMHYAQAFLDDSCAPALLCLYSLDANLQDALNAFLASLRFRNDDPDCQQRAAADTLWWMSTLTGGKMPTGNAPSHVQRSQPAMPEVFIVSDTSVSISLPTVHSRSCSYRLLGADQRVIASGIIGPAPFSDYLLLHTNGRTAAQLLEISLDDGSILRVNLHELSTRTSVGQE
jgi:hypothetical protein